jgi:hypothetical protein
MADPPSVDLRRDLQYASEMTIAGPYAAVLNRPGTISWEPPRAPIRLGLEGCGLATSDTAAVLAQYAAGTTQKEVAAGISAGQLLSKRSAKGRQHILTAIRRRYLEHPGPLPGPATIAAALQRLKAPIARHQLLLPYVLLSDRALHHLLLGYIEERRTLGSHLTKQELVAAVARLFESQGQKAWSPAVTKRWVEGVLSVLRDLGALGKGRDRERLLAYVLRPEVFAFHLWGLYEAGYRGPALLDPTFWRLLLLREGDVRLAARAIADRGWWRFTSVAGVDELRPVHRSLPDWIANGLG